MITQQILKENLHYEPETGIFTRLKSLGNAVKIGDVAGYDASNGYRFIEVCGKRYLAHRLAWLWMTAQWPREEIDHINLSKADNRWSNLREATRSQNAAHRKAQANNTHGWKGVSWHRKTQKWRAIIRGRNLGYFDCPATAHFTYLIAADRAFGVFARNVW